MACRGVWFAIDEKMKDKLESMSRTEIVDYAVDELEELFFSEKRDRLAELDKSWDATQRAFANGKLAFAEGGKEGEYPLNCLIYGERTLYGDKEGEEDYIITLNSPNTVKDICHALQQLDEAAFKERYWAIDEAEYNYPMSEEDCSYSWDYLHLSLAMWERASRQELYVIFTVDQ